jgi:acyl carrier protein
VAAGEMNKQNTRQIIRNFVAKELKRRYGTSTSGKSDTSFEDHDSLILSKKTDSLFFVDLIVFLETEFSFDISASEVSKEDLDSVDKMVALIESKK